MSNVIITTRRDTDLATFLEMNGYLVEYLENNILKVTRDNELPVFISVTDATLYFEVDLGNVADFAGGELYFKLLDLNTEILPVSFGINNTNSEDPRLVLVESRVTGDLNNHEILAVFDALELATDRAETLLAGYL